MGNPKAPAVDGWFTTGDPPALLGGRCTTCGTIVFPNRRPACPNPDCDGTEFSLVELSRRGKVWSHTMNHYPPPEPYVSPEPFTPYAVAAVELAEEGMIVLGQVQGEVGVGDEVELVLGELADGALMWQWRRPT